MTAPLVIAYGGGLNSTSMLVGFKQRGIRPDLILFADTGGEKPATYAYLDTMDAWLESVEFPPLIRVENGGKDPTLEIHCNRTHTLPSLAYGFKKCSHRYKREPQDRFVNNWSPARIAWKAGLKVSKAIGYDAGEERRAGIPEDKKYVYTYPLINWGWFREECAAAITSEGLPVPPKSACFFCPASTKKDVLALSRCHRDLFDRAVAMERNAAETLNVVKGLGRHWTWEALVAADAAQLKLFVEPMEQACDCYDGSADPDDD